MTDLTALADRIRSEAYIADRPGQMGRLEAIADELADAEPIIRAAERAKWLHWASVHACCEAGLVASPEPCPWHPNGKVADALSRFSITEFPNGKIQTLIADGTHWVTVSTANSMVDRARADERERAIADCYADWRIGRADLRAKVEEWDKRYTLVEVSDVLALLKEKP